MVKFYIQSQEIELAIIPYMENCQILKTCVRIIFTNLVSHFHS